MDICKKLIYILIINFFILDFSFCFYFLVGQAIGVLYITGIYGGSNEQNIFPIVLISSAVILYINKLLFLPFFVKYMQNVRKDEFWIDIFYKLRKNFKYQIVILILAYLITLTFLYIHTHLFLLQILLYGFLLSSASSYLLLFLYWRIEDIIEGC